MSRYLLRAATLAAGASFAAASLAACGGARTVSIPGVGSMKATHSGEVITSGGHSLAATTRIPSNFPSSVPIPSHTRIIEALTGTNAPGSRGGGGGGGAGGSVSFDLTLAVPGPPAAAAAAYTSRLESAGFTLSSSGGSGPEAVVLAHSPSWGVNAIFSASSPGGAGGEGLRAGECELTLDVVPAGSGS